MLAASAASAQVVGTFRWQLAPYCNVVTLTVVQNGPVAFSLHGTDDQCGAPQYAAVSGSAHLNPDGTAAIAFTVVRPDGLAMPASATINLTTLAGGWLDEWSTRGTFVFNPASSSGSPRPILLQGFAQVQFRSAAVLQQAETTLVSFGRNLPFTPTLHIVTDSSNAQCGGGVISPVPQPGQLCFYVLDSTNVLAATGAVGTKWR